MQTHTYTLREVQSMLGISRAVISGLMASGFVTPARGERREYRFSFQDVVLLRTAHSLQQASITPRKILRSLRRLSATLPGELPLAGLRISAVGSEVAVRQGDAQWGVESGQLLFDFEVKPAQGSVSFLSKPLPERAKKPDVDWFERAVEFEAANDKASAEAAYRRALEKAPDRPDAYLNLGVLLCDARRRSEAVALYRQALRHCPNEALVHFNLGVALDDLGRPDEALACYQTSIRLDPALADAHYNAARLHELLGHSSKAIRHYSEYRRLQRRGA